MIHNEELEKVIIGSVLLEKRLSYETRQLSTVDFYFKKNSQVWTTFCEMDEENELIEIPALQARLPENGYRLSDLSKIVSGIPPYTIGTKEIKQLKNLSAMRTLRDGLAALHRRTDHDALSDVLEDAEGLVKAIRGEQDKENGNAKILADVYEREVFPMLDKYVAGEMVKIPFGFDALDVATNGGCGMGELILFGAKPKSGKSAWLTQLGRNQASRGLGVYACSREMLNYENGERIIAQTTQYTVNHFRSGLYQSTADSMKETARSQNWPFFLDDKTKTVKGIKHEVLRLDGEGYDITSILVDYAQLMKGEDVKGKTTADILEGIIYGLKDLATDLEKVVYVNAQFNREGIDSAKPKMSDFKGSSAIEMAANKIIFWTLEQETDSFHNARKGEMWIEAGRNVAYDKFDILYHGDKTLFSFL